MEMSTAPDRRFAVRFHPLIDLDTDTDGNVLGIDAEFGSTVTEDVWDYASNEDKEDFALSANGGAFAGEHVVPAIRRALAEVCATLGIAYHDDQSSSPFEEAP